MARISEKRGQNVSFWLHESRALRLLRGLSAVQRVLFSCLTIGTGILITHYLLMIAVRPSADPLCISLSLAPRAPAQQKGLGDFLQLLACHSFAMAAVEPVPGLGLVLISGKTNFFMLQKLLDQALAENLNALVAVQSILRERDGLVGVKFLCKGSGGKTA